MQPVIGPPFHTILNIFPGLGGHGPTSPSPSGYATGHCLCRVEYLLQHKLLTSKLRQRSIVVFGGRVGACDHHEVTCCCQRVWRPLLVCTTRVQQGGNSSTMCYCIDRAKPSSKSGGKRESQRGSVILAARLQNSSGHCSNILPVKRVMGLCQSVMLSGRIHSSI